MKRILSIAMVVAMMFALCVASFAATETVSCKCTGPDDILDFTINEAKKNKPTFTTDGEISFKNPAEDNTAADAFITREGSFALAYGTKFTFTFEMKLNAIAGDTTTNDIFQIQIKDGTGAWGANYKFFTVTGDGAGKYILHDANNSALPTMALDTVDWYKFVLEFDLEADTCKVSGAVYNQDNNYPEIYTSTLNAQGDITKMLFGECDEKTDWVYDYLVDSLTFIYEVEDEETTVAEQTTVVDETTATAGTEAAVTTEAPKADDDTKADFPVVPVAIAAVAVVVIIIVVAAVASKKKK